MINFINKKPTMEDIFKLGYWCKNGMSPLEMEERKVEDMFEYIEKTLLKYRNNKYIDQNEYLTMNRDLLLLMSNHVKKRLKASSPSQNKNYSKYMNDPDYGNTST